MKKSGARKTANVYIYDEFSPEDTAMMQALYSRSPESVTIHAEKVKKSGSGNFMERFYVGYGHASIADCGSSTVFVEGVSILTDKVLQDWPLYSGQETSTRYVDMSKQPIIDPIGSKESQEILNSWMDFYLKSGKAVEKHISEKYPKKPSENTDIYNKAVKARVFDILRGFLPAGITTQLSWHTNLRQACEKLALMKHHPLSEAREVAEEIFRGLKDKYPHSFSHQYTTDQETYRNEIMNKYSYFNPSRDYPEFEATSDLNKKELEKNISIFDERPPKTNMPRFLGEYGNITFKFLLDYGCFRDIQRHRNGYWRIPLLTTKYGFSKWYLEQLPNDLKEKAEKLIDEQIKKISKLNVSEEIKQYYVAMGFKSACKLVYSLPEVVYVAELRSGKTVHPALRIVAHKMGRYMSKNYPFVKLHCDYDTDEWDTRRGNQDIKEKK